MEKKRSKKWAVCCGSAPSKSLPTSIQGVIKWSYRTYQWPFKFVTGVMKGYITLLNGSFQSHFWRNENSPCFFPIKCKLESQNPSHIELFHPTKLRGLFLGWALPSTHLNGPHPHLFLRTSAPGEIHHGSNPPRMQARGKGVSLEAQESLSKMGKKTPLKTTKNMATIVIMISNLSNSLIH